MGLATVVKSLISGFIKPGSLIYQLCNLEQVIQPMETSTIFIYKMGMLTLIRKLHGQGNGQNVKTFRKGPTEQEREGFELVNKMIIGDKFQQSDEGGSKIQMGCKGKSSIRDSFKKFGEEKEIFYGKFRKRLCLWNTYRIFMIIKLIINTMHLDQRSHSSQ